MAHVAGEGPEVIHSEPGLLEVLEGLFGHEPGCGRVLLREEQDGGAAGGGIVEDVQVLVLELVADPAAGGDEELGIEGSAAVVVLQGQCYQAVGVVPAVVDDIGGGVLGLGFLAAVLAPDLEC